MKVLGTAALVLAAGSRNQTTPACERILPVTQNTTLINMRQDIASSLESQFPKINIFDTCNNQAAPKKDLDPSTPVGKIITSVCSEEKFQWGESGNTRIKSTFASATTLEVEEKLQTKWNNYTICAPELPSDATPAPTNSTPAPTPKDTNSTPAPNNSTPAPTPKDTPVPTPAATTLTITVTENSNLAIVATCVASTAIVGALASKVCTSREIRQLKATVLESQNQEYQPHQDQGVVSPNTPSATSFPQAGI